MLLQQCDSVTGLGPLSFPVAQLQQLSDVYRPGPHSLFVSRLFRRVGRETPRYREGPSTPPQTVLARFPSTRLSTLILQESHASVSSLLEALSDSTRIPLPLGFRRLLRLLPFPWTEGFSPASPPNLCPCPSSTTFLVAESITDLPWVIWEFRYRIGPRDL